MPAVSVSLPSRKAQRTTASENRALILWRPCREQLSGTDPCPFVDTARDAHAAGGGIEQLPVINHRPAFHSGDIVVCYVLVGDQAAVAEGLEFLALAEQRGSESRRGGRKGLPPLSWQ
jgi:hypothetical protein